MLLHMSRHEGVIEIKAIDFNSVIELVICLSNENTELEWGERKAKRFVGIPAEYRKPPIKVEFKTAADVKEAIYKLRLGGQILNIKKYYDRLPKVVVSVVPTEPRAQRNPTPQQNAN